MRVAAVDIGTNSIRLLIADYKDGQLEIIKRKLAEPRLGAGSQNSNYLAKPAIKRSIKVLKSYQKLAQEFDTKLVAVATSAVREAKNKGEFLTEVKAELAIEIKVLTGAKEAYLSYQGMVKGLNDLKEDILAIDIGGGSTEFITGQAKDYDDYQSFKVGAVRLSEDFATNYQLMRKEIKRVIKDYLKTKTVNELIGVGGTITTLVAIKKSLANYQPELIHGYKLNKKEIEKIFKQLKSLSLANRKEVVGLSPKRADIILPGIMILLTIMQLAKVEEIKVSDQGILEGIIYDFNQDSH